MPRFSSAVAALLIALGACAPFTPGTPVVPPPSEVPKSGTLIFEDDFSLASSGWTRQRTPEGIMDYDAGGYRILVSGPETNFWATARQSLADVRLEVDAAKLGGPDENRLGLLCRKAGDAYYFFLITSDGYFGVGLFSGGEALLLGSPQMEFSDQILTGMAVNHLQVECMGQELSLRVNGSHLVTVADDRLAAGDVGLIAGTFSTPGADIIFDNFQAFVP